MTLISLLEQRFGHVKDQDVIVESQNICNGTNISKIKILSYLIPAQFVSDIGHTFLNSSESWEDNYYTY